MMTNKLHLSTLGIALLLLFGSCGGAEKKVAENDGLETAADRVEKTELPPKAEVGEGALVRAELIYPLENRPTPQVHASTLVETSNGIVAAFFAGTHERNPDVGIRVSHLENGKWTRPEEVVNGVQNDSLRYPCWNPVLFQPADGPLMLFYKVGPNPREWWGMLITSTDGGKSWSAPQKLGEDPAIGALIGPVKNKPVQLEDGTIIAPSSIEIEQDGETFWKVHFEISRDQGRTWQVVGPINDGVAFDAIQPSILIHDNGDLQVLCRTRQGVIAESWSSDQGQTWSEMQATSLPNPNSGTDAVSLQDGRHLLVYNHSTKEGEEPNGRNILNLAISADGKTWEPFMTLENEPNKAGYSYPAIIQSEDGMVHISYTYDRETVKYVVINPSDI
ncbi:Predicted neuraminidase (sialidase) [Cyclobacterium lianum]|uniref:Predicted neuraminidase (Sialidase) n=1 Tax=Cyclobacterium lianum TaxID=388280 RepID=A0A1M7PVZ6_9BACT|nr:sialidase family protein [Cyclobacterium lianum]SHN21708.1 Predicted neuraminidase (sialidase) [Cyclobacterium lianum]